ncbi:MAG: hypothetical protein K6E30_05260 [Lachnospiraceae bacterium]|nr:hypothetical protein [Lachnospiraceae bacterium]
MKGALLRLLPRILSNRFLLFFWDLLSVRESGRPFRRKERKQEPAGRPGAGTGGFIENQGDYFDVSYGKATMAYAGCEIIAAFNALFALSKERPDLTELIQNFEGDGMSLSGRFGTSPAALVRFFEKRGFETESALSEEDFDSLAERSSALLLVYYNDRFDLGAMVHTIYVEKKEAPGPAYVAHNAGGNGKAGPSASSVRELLQRLGSGRAGGILLIGIR